MSEMSNVGCRIICRAAEPGDREQVLSMGDVYGGVDYMDYMYEKFTTNQQYRSFVCEVDGRIASFRFYRIIDDNESIIGGGVRTHVDFQGRNLGKRLGEASARDILKEYPRIFRNYLMTAIESPFQRQRIRENPNEYTLLSERNVLSLRITTSAIKAFINGQKPSSTTTIRPSLDDFLKHTLKDETQTKLFPDKYITVGWEPFRIIKSNLSNIYNERNILWTLGAEGDPEWLTIECIYPCETGFRIDLDMYGVEPNCLATHLVQSLASAVARYPDVEAMCELLIYTPIQFPITEDLFERDVSPGALAACKTYLVIHRNMMQYLAS
ncbi:hypothetical protein CAPTEDRAFT_201293 [Capitella teleta]|uniref:Histidine N-acetyltransferase C-terminal domain-containing protein n=1 Tax=Capitella teleta TaxID=283909 RepID=R7UZK8_CAPTE|nr:hypothetical protein CAPTEDRAFT_201293 [Capitella teleta]|eukprot:ELU09402.1 hypothetical protein CAPTEDRAFT_201293 [Capitella teleta]